MPYSFNPKIIYESMTLYRFFVFASINTNKESTAPCPPVSYCPVRGTGAWASIVQLHNTTSTLYTAFCSNAGWWHVFFCFCYPSSSRQWRGRGLKTLCELTVEDWGLGMNPASCPGLAPAQPPPPILQHTPIFSSGPVVQLCPPPNFTTAQHTKTGAHNTFSINSVLL